MRQTKGETSKEGRVQQLEKEKEKFEEDDDVELVSIEIPMRRKEKVEENDDVELVSIVVQMKGREKVKEGSSSYSLALEEARRHSISHVPSHSFATIDEPSRASSCETRAPRKRRHHLPTPSPPSSDNISFHLSDSYSEG